MSNPEAAALFRAALTAAVNRWREDGPTILYGKKVIWPAGLNVAAINRLAGEAGLVPAGRKVYQTTKTTDGNGCESKWLTVFRPDGAEAARWKYSSNSPGFYLDRIRDQDPDNARKLLPSKLAATVEALAAWLALCGEKHGDPPHERPTPSEEAAVTLADQWELGVGRFRIGRRWYDLTGQSLNLLQAFVEAKDYTLTKQQVNRACSISAARPSGYVSDLNRKLKKLFKLRTGPVRPIYGEGAYRLDAAAVLEKAAADAV